MNGRGIKRSFWGRQSDLNPMQQEMMMQRNGWDRGLMMERGDPMMERGGRMMGGMGPMMGGGGPMMGGGGRPMMGREGLLPSPMMGDEPMVHPLMNRMGVKKKSSSNRVKVLFDPSVKKNTLEKIFNIVPGFVSLEFIEMVAKGAVAGVTYDNPLSAQHALERIQGLEYPADCPLELDMVPPDTEEEEEEAEQPQQKKPTGQMMERYLHPEFDAQMLSSVDLPETQPLGSEEDDIEKIVFFSVHKRNDDRSLPNPHLLYKNLFCRFGNLKYIHMMRGKMSNPYWLANYTKEASGEAAIETLNGSTLAGYPVRVREFKDHRKDMGNDDAEGGDGKMGLGRTKGKAYINERRIYQMDGDEWLKDETDAAELSSVDLPELKDMMPMKTFIKKTVFFCLYNVDYGTKLPPFTVYSNLFRRFGNLIKIVRFGNRKGLANFADAESAEAAIKALHESKLGGISLSVREYANREEFAERKEKEKRATANLEEY